MKSSIRVAVLAASVVALLAPASSMAAPATGYEAFASCPDKTVNSAIVQCVVTNITGGHLQMGTKDTPIEEPLKLTIATGSTPQVLYSNLDSGLQRIPGGLIGITGLDWLRFIYPLNLLQIYAEPELAGPVTNPNPPIGVPLKVQLHNVLLNSNCYIGADNDPISLNLTTGTTAPPPPNQPISGSPGTPAPNPNAPAAFFVNNLALVDNSFAAPVARNCDLLSLNLLVTALVNAQAGLPSPAGTNTAVQTGSLALSNVFAIYPPNGID